MEDSEEDSGTSSDSEEFLTYREESPSSGFVDDTEESVSLRSESTSSSSTGKPKKRVTFESGDNLVLIREIPRRNKSKIDSDISDTDSEEIDVECAGKDDVFVSHSSGCIAKGRYEVKKSPGRTAAKIAAITGASLLDTRNRINDAKKVSKRRTAKREKRKTFNESSDTSENTDSSKSTKQKTPKTKSKKSTAKKPENKTTYTKAKGNKSFANDTVSSTTENSSDSQSYLCSTMNKDGTQPNSNSRDNDGNFSHVLFAEQTLNSGTPKRLSNLLDKNENSTAFETIHKVCMVENEMLSINDNGLPCLDRLDIKSMSTTNRRLYSWLMANGNIPNPQHQTPSISPMWETS